MKPEELKMALTLLGWNYRRMAREIGVSHSSIWKWCSGLAKIPRPAEILIRIRLKENGFKPHLDVNSMKLEADVKAL